MVGGAQFTVAILNGVEQAHVPTSQEIGLAQAMLKKGLLAHRRRIRAHVPPMRLCFGNQWPTLNTKLGIRRFGVGPMRIYTTPILSKLSHQTTLIGVGDYLQINSH